MKQSARLFEESDFVVEKTVDRVNLEQGDGLDWSQVRIEHIVAEGITETTVNENFQELEDTIFSVTPGMTQVTVRITDKTYRRIASTVGPLLGKGIQLAMNRKLEEDGIAQFALWSNSVAGLSGLRAVLFVGLFIGPPPRRPGPALRVSERTTAASGYTPLWARPAPRAPDPSPRSVHCASPRCAKRSGGPRPGHG